MNVSYYNQNDEIITKNDLDISWIESLTDRSPGEDVEFLLGVENNTGADIDSIMLSVQPDISIMYFNDRTQSLSALSLQVMLSNVLAFGVESYKEIIFTTSNKYVNPKNDWKVPLTFEIAQIHDMTKLDGLKMYSGESLTARDNFGFFVSKGHYYASIAEDNSGVPGTYYKSLTLSGFTDGTKLNFWVKISIPVRWDPHYNPLTVMVKTYCDNELLDNNLRICLRNVYGYLDIPIHGFVIPFTAEEFPFTIGG